MMVSDQQMNGQSLRDALAPALRVLKQLGGSIVFSDEEGEQFVIARRRDVEDVQASHDKQLSLPTAETVSRAIRKNIPSDIDDDVLERINRDIALTQAQELQEDEFTLPRDEKREHTSAPSVPKPPPVRVKFEPLRGDLPPELQE